MIRVSLFRGFCLVAIALALRSLSAAETHTTAAGIVAALRNASVDPEQSYRVRELHLRRGDIDIYFTEGVLSFVTPVDGRSIGAIFTTEGTEAGDAEILVLPPTRSERASLASFINSPNLDEHFNSALFLFSDNTAKELLAQIQDKPIHKAPDAAARIAPAMEHSLIGLSSQVRLRLVEALLDGHDPAQGFFYAVIAGREHGVFEAMHDPTDPEPIHVGRAEGAKEGDKYELWTSFRPRHSPAFIVPSPSLSDYRIDAIIHPDLTMSVTAQFRFTAPGGCGRVLRLGLSDRLAVVSATVDGKPAEVYQRDADSIGQQSSGSFLLISDDIFEAGREYAVEVHYQGSVIRQTRDGQYFVDERNLWYPYRTPMLTNFDLTFQCPTNLRLVSTGELISEKVARGTRVVHRRTELPEHLAGFNLGEYSTTTEERSGYRVDCYFNKNAELAPAQDQFSISPSRPLPDESMRAMENIPSETATILDDYTRRWMRLPIHSIAVSPIPGYFGQGFPGLIYLSSVSYLRKEDRPSQLRNPRMDAFFSEMLLPHEIAHQWWGNIVTAMDYRTEWLMEAMANYSALQFLERSKGSGARNAVLEQYRDDLLQEANGKAIEAAGPVDFGMRLETNSGPLARHIIVYEKGAWILHMLHERLGDEAFLKMQDRLLQEFHAKPITNESFRRVAADFLRTRDPDETLSTFFDTWIYGTGIPKLRLEKKGREYSIEVSGVDEDFTTDIPLRCASTGGTRQVHWMRVTSGATPVPVFAHRVSTTLLD